MAPEQRGVCVVLGAGLDGIGGAVASRFAAEGFTVVVSKRKPAPLEALVERIAAQGWHAVAHPADARSEEEVEGLVAAAEAIGPIRVAVYNVGANPGYVALRDTTPRLFQQNWEMGALGGFLFGRAVAAAMERRGAGGTILFTGATSSARAKAGSSAFASTKAALRALSQAMYRELSPIGVHVSHVVVDGAVEGNPVLLQRFPERYEKMKADGLLLSLESVAAS